MTAREIVAELKTLGNDGYKRIMLNHGAKEPIYGVKIEDMKKIQKRVKRDYQLALDLYDTGVSDAMYLAGLIAVGSYVKSLTDHALKTAARIGSVTVNMGGTACKVPAAAEYIRKVQKRGTIGKKRKTVKC